MLKNFFKWQHNKYDKTELLTEREKAKHGLLDVDEYPTKYKGQ